MPEKDYMFLINKLDVPNRKLTKRGCSSNDKSCLRRCRLPTIVDAHNYVMRLTRYSLAILSLSPKADRPSEELDLIRAPFAKSVRLPAGVAQAVETVASRIEAVGRSATLAAPLSPDPKC